MMICPDRAAHGQHTVTVTTDDGTVLGAALCGGRRWIELPLACREAIGLRNQLRQVDPQRAARADAVDPLPTVLSADGRRALVDDVEARRVLDAETARMLLVFAAKTEHNGGWR